MSRARAEDQCSSWPPPAERGGAARASLLVWSQACEKASGTLTPAGLTSVICCADAKAGTGSTTSVPDALAHHGRSVAAKFTGPSPPRALRPVADAAPVHAEPATDAVDTQRRREVDAPADLALPRRALARASRLDLEASVSRRALLAIDRAADPADDATEPLRPMEPDAAPAPRCSQASPCDRLPAGSPGSAAASASAPACGSEVLDSPVAARSVASLADQRSDVRSGGVRASSASAPPAPCCGVPL